jgi:hypothetical protein
MNDFLIYDYHDNFVVLFTGWLTSKETRYFFNFYLIDRRLGLIFLPHILGHNK